MSVTCIGLDIAWFGGSKSNLESQADCVAAVHINETGKTRFEINRVNLNSHDLSSLQIYGAITQIITRTASDQTRIVIAIDAPLQSAGHEDLPAMREIGGPVARRACENYLSKHRQEIDEAARGSAGWQPNIQPGAPIAPRISNLLTILQESGFAVWIPQNNDSPRTVIEAFPAEAIWAVKRQGGYPDNITAADAKKYKAKEISHQQLTEGEIAAIVHTALDGFDEILPPFRDWPNLVAEYINWLIASGNTRGGKFLDDSIDTMICLATAISFAYGTAHLWQDPTNPADGHIFGPGDAGQLSAFSQQKKPEKE